MTRSSPPVYEDCVEHERVRDGHRPITSGSGLPASIAATDRVEEVLVAVCHEESDAVVDVVRCREHPPEEGAGVLIRPGVEEVEEVLTVPFRIRTVDQDLTQAVVQPCADGGGLAARRVSAHGVTPTADVMDELEEPDELVVDQLVVAPVDPQEVAPGPIGLVGELPARPDGSSIR